MDVPPRNKKGARTGFTTGACAAAAAKAAARCLVRGVMLSEIETTLPNGKRVTFPLARCKRGAGRAMCSVIKDAGDDPDCTHGAELIAEVSLSATPGIAIRGGAGVATVTKPGLGLEVGQHAINPIPRRNITEMVLEELAGTALSGATVIITVPRGEEIALQTTNARLGLLGGISILGTSGIVRPYSTAAFKASVVQEIDVASAAELPRLVLTTGGKSEQYALALHPDLPESAFIQVGDFIGVGLRHAARRQRRQVIIVGMIGKLSKMAKGTLQTHVAGSQVDLGFLAELARRCGGSTALVEEIQSANTARHALELCREAGLTRIASAVCERVVRVCSEHVQGQVEVHAELVDFGGELLGRYPLPRSASQTH